MYRQFIVKMIGNVSDCLFIADGALIKVTDSASSSVHGFPHSGLVTDFNTTARKVK